MSRQTKVASNTTWFTSALVGQKVISFAYFTFLARSLGAADIGLYTFALSYIAIFSIIIDYGLSNLITREVAKSQNDSQKLYSTVLGFKLISSLFAVVCAVIFLHILGYPAFTRHLVYVALVLMVVESLVLSSYAIIRGHHHLRYESFGMVGVQLAIAGLGVLLLKFTDDIRWLVGVLLTANTIHLFYVTFLLVKKWGMRIRLIFEKKYTFTILKLATPFAVAAGFTRVYGAFDQVLLSKLASPEALGYYAVAYKLTFALQFIPLALVAALYPAMSTYYVQEKTMLNKAFTRSVYYLLVFTLPLSFGVATLAKPFIHTLYTTNFSDAIAPLQILILSLTFLFINFPLGALLNATNRQKRNTINIGGAMVVNIILNVILIPKFQALGAAWASLISTIFLFVVSWHAVYNLLRLDYGYIIRIFFKTLFSSLVMTLWLNFAMGILPWILAALIGMLVYIVCQITLRAITIRDIKQLMESFYKK